MVFTSLPLYNWNNQDANQQPDGQIITSDSFRTPPLLQPAGGGVGGGGSGGQGTIRPGSMVDRARLARIPLPEAGLKCPRCESTNTKFCYFNNYNLSQPRHFCKACRRYWTRGGSLRNVPVGGGCRRNKRSKRHRSKSSGGNTSGCDLSSQVPPQPQTQFPFLPSIHRLSGYVNGDFGLDLGSGRSGEAGFELGATSAGSSRVQLEYPSFASGSDVRPTGLYPFHEGELDPDLDLDLDHGTRMKMEGNQGLDLSKSTTMLGNQGNDDQFNLWSTAGNAWNDLSGFHSSSAGNLL